MRHHRLKPVETQDRFVGADLVEPFPLGKPTSLAELKQGRRVSRARQCQVVVRRGVEVNADQGKEDATLTVSGPKDLIMPMGVFPADPFERIDLGQAGEEPGLKPLSLLSEKVAGVIDVHFFGEMPDGTTQDEPARDQAGGKHSPPDHYPHGRVPVRSLGVSETFIVETYPRESQGYVDEP